MAHILLAEDDEQLREYLTRGLTRAGHSVDPFADGDAALVQSRKSSYDLLLADIVMPGLNGIELARQVSQEQPGIKIMFITGFAAVALQDDSLGPNRPTVLAKPFHLRHLIEEIEHLMTQ
jgi:two-component system cell cycle response regulator CpdR